MRMLKSIVSLSIVIQSSLAVDRLISTLPATNDRWTYHNVHPDPLRCEKPQFIPNANDGFAWCGQKDKVDSNPQNPDTWVQVDLGQEYIIDSVSTWGRIAWIDWVTSYRLEYSSEPNLFTSLGTMDGNSDATTEQRNPVSIIARYLRFTPLTYFKWPVMRIEVSGRLSSSGRQYTVFPAPVLGSQAKTACEDMGTTLGTVITQSDVTNLIAAQTEAGVPRDRGYFIGLRQLNCAYNGQTCTYGWDDDTPCKRNEEWQGTGTTIYENTCIAPGIPDINIPVDEYSEPRWTLNQPVFEHLQSTQIITESTTDLSKRGNALISIAHYHHGASSLGYICNAVRSGRKYTVFPGPVIGSQARAACESMGTTLATVRTQADVANLRKAQIAAGLDTSRGIFTGLHQEDCDYNGGICRYEWYDGSSCTVNEPWQGTGHGAIYVANTCIAPGIPSSDIPEDEQDLIRWGETEPKFEHLDATQIYTARPFWDTAKNIDLSARGNAVFGIAHYHHGKTSLAYACNADAPSSGITYIGCYRDTGNRALPYREGTVTSPEECAINCGSYAYFGVQAGFECWCGDSRESATQYGELPSTDCPVNQLGAAWSQDLFENLDYVGAKTGGLNLDFISGSLSEDGTIQIGAYVFLGVIVLLVVNIICFSIYCWNKCKSSSKNKGYKVVRYDTETSDV